MFKIVFLPQMPNILLYQTYLWQHICCVRPQSTVKDAWHQRSEKLFLTESGAPCPPFPYVILGPSRSIRTLSRVVLLSGTAEPGTCPPPLLHHVCLYSFSLSLSQFQSTESTLLNMSDEEETDYSQTEGESEQSEGEEEDDEGGVHRDRWNDKDDQDSDEDDEDDVDDGEDEDLPHLDGYLEGYNRGYRDALRENYPSDEETDYSQTEGESEQSEEEVEDDVDGEDQDQTEPESEEEYQVERPHSPDTCRLRCKTRCRFPVRS